jgi:hypothetical protein
MLPVLWPQRSRGLAGLILALFVFSLPSWAADKVHFHADDYQI